MGLELDERRRAMLQEMGLQQWWPAASVAAAPVSRPGRIAAASAPAPEVRAVVAETTVASDPVPTSRFQTASVDWIGLLERVSACSECALCQGRRKAVFQNELGPRQADWLVLGEPPDADEERDGEPFAADAGRLLDNMLRAVGVHRRGEGAQGARLSNAVRCRPTPARNPEPAELAACAVHLWQEVSWAQPKVILAMGRFAALSLLGPDQPETAALPLARLRGRVHRARGYAVVVTHHPARLLRAPGDKAQAWVDLCLARAVALGEDS